MKNLFHSSVERLIDLPYELAYHQYVVLGLIESLKTYVSEFVSTFNEIDYTFLMEFQEILTKISEVWDHQISNSDELTTMVK
jgi:hypothetical protein